jgi:hypothetical protein
MKKGQRLWLNLLFLIHNQNVILILNHQFTYSYGLLRFPVRPVKNGTGPQ